jgi:hypothetical protein
LKIKKIMKKVFLSLAVVAMLASCGGAQQEEQVEETVEQVEETAEEVVEEVQEDSSQATEAPAEEAAH